MASNVTENIDGYEFSDNQKKLWNAGKDQLNLFHNQMVLTLDQDKTTEDVLQAIHTIVNAHEVFTFKTHNNEQYYYPVQYQSDQEGIDYFEVDSNSDNLKDTIDSYMSTSFHPSKDAAIRFCFTMQNNFVKTIHVRLYSLWGDTYSLLFLTKRMSSLLGNTNEENTEDADAIPYLNYATWQNDLIKNPEDDAKAFWKTYADEKGKTIIPFQKEATENFAPKRKQIAVINGTSQKQFEALCTRKNGSLSDGLLYQYLSFLATFTKENITIGYVQNDRTYDELKNTLGLVNKTLPVVFDATSIIQNAEIETIKNQLEEVTNWSDYFTIKKDDAQQCFNYCFEYITANDIEAISVDDIYSVQNTFKVKLTCIAYKDKLVIDAYYDAGYYAEQDFAVIEAQLKKHFTALKLQSETTCELSDVEQKIIETANHTTETFKAYNSITELIDEQADTNPEAIAIVFESTQITYGALQRKVNKLANYMVHEHNVSKGDAVCILLDRSELFVVSLLSVLKTGAYYIPISKEYPQERIQFILEDATCKLLLTDVVAYEQNDTMQVEILNPVLVEKYQDEAETFSSVVEMSDTAYCIYTSGSTGNPKGCLISHENLLNYISWANEYYFENTDYGNWGFFTAVSFDLSVTAIFTSLTRGKKLTIENEQTHISELLKKSFEDATIDTLKLTPAHISLLATLDIQETSVRVLICGGEQLTQQQVRTVKSIHPEIKIFNEYGPTEATVGCITKEMTTNEKISIGKPISNMAITIITDKNQVCEVGAIGEIIISGTGVAKGYLNREALTAEKFVDELVGIKGNYYKTGDLGRWTPDGNIDFLGRKDDQVKIRGYRIELAEIEQHLVQYNLIDEAVVIVKENETTGKELIAYVRSTETLNVAMIQEHLTTRIPEYMLPEHYVQLTVFPLTINGKVDRKALPEPYGMALSSGVAYEAPSTETEQKLVDIWEEILKRDQIGINDNFFLIGGNSLKAMTVINHLHKTFEVKLQLKDFFQSATIADIADQIDALIGLRSIKEEMNSEKEFESEIIL